MSSLLIEANRRLIAALEDALGPNILSAIKDRDVIEILLNPDGTLFVDHLADGMREFGRLLPSDAETIIGKVAHALQTEVSQSNPILSGELPIGGHRFEGLLPPVVSKPVFSIRKKASKLFTLDEYVASGALSALGADILRSALRDRFNLIISGGTGSGKTTLANAIMAEISLIDPDHRLIILEDTAEIQACSKNVVQLHTSDEIDMRRLLKSTMRLRPDRIIVGEVRDGAALTLLKAWNTGHPGGLATLHANSAFSALSRLEQLTAEVSSKAMSDVIGEAVDLILHMERTPQGRKVTSILKVEAYSDGAYHTHSVLPPHEVLHAI